MSAPAETAPFTLRWGIIGTGLIASWFVSDLIRDPVQHRGQHEVKHVVQAIGSSSHTKARAFAEKHITAAGSTAQPSLYDSYEQVYADPNVDIVYIATPHALHLKNTLDAIHAGKNVLCEKPMAITAKDAERMVSAAQEKGVYLMEAVWTRFFPLSRELHRLIHIENAIGRPTRALIDFGLDMPLDKQPAGSRVADLSLGAGSLLDIGIYSLTWASMALQPVSDRVEPADDPRITSSMTLNKGVDEMSTVVLNYTAQRAQAICTASYLYKSGPEFGRIEGTEGTICIRGRATSKPGSLVVKRKGEEGEKIMDFTFEGWGFFYEADAVAKDIRDGKKENDIMPLRETIRMMKVMDEVRQQNGLKYPQDNE